MFDGMKLDVIPEGDDEPLCDVEFVDNLTIEGVPDYVNENCRIGITRYPYERYAGWFVLMHIDTVDPSRYYTELLTPKEAYDYLKRHDRFDLINEFDIHYEREREVI